MLVAMTVAGSDSSGGAGLQADLKAFASEGVHGAVAITAITAQNTCRVSRIFSLPPEQVAAQIDAVLEDVHVSAAKTGMLYSGAMVRTVAERLKGEGIPLVVDPVMVAGVGDALSGEDLAAAIRTELAPLATILTPNVPEAETLLGRPIVDEAGMKEACRELAGLGCEAVLLKGGHLEGATSLDMLYHRGRFLVLEYPRVAIRGHGGGCTLAALLAANLAKGRSLGEAVMRSKAAVHRAVLNNYPIGSGVPVVSPLGHLYREARSYEVSERLLRAARDLAAVLSREWVPESGCDMAYALPGAASSADVCGLECRIVSFGDGALLPAGAAFGASERSAAAVLAAMTIDGGMRSAAGLRCSPEGVSRLRKDKMKFIALNMDDAGGNNIINREDIMSTAIKGKGFVPDAVLERGGEREPVLHLIGRDPEDVLSKVRKLVE